MKVPQPKKVSEPIDDSSEEEQRSKKVSRPSDGKNVSTKTGKKVKKTTQPKKALKSPEFIESEEEEEGLPKDDKGKKIPSLLGMKEESQSFFDTQKDSKNLTIKKKVERVVFMAGPYEVYDTKYLKRVLKRSGLEKKTKGLIKQTLAKT